MTVNKFAVMACPEEGCPKIGFDPESTCPTHNVLLERTVVWSDREVQRKLRRAKADGIVEGARSSGSDLSTILKDLGLGSR